jgi:hypothetical protein
VQAVAAFLQEGEQADQPSSRFDNQTPFTYALAHSDRDNLPWVVAVRSGTIRLYSTATSGQRGRAETFVELNLPLLPSDRAGYLSLLFSSDALAKGGTFSEIQQASTIYASDLSERLRERVYKQVVPQLAVAVADRVGGKGEEDLERHGTGKVRLGLIRTPPKENTAPAEECQMFGLRGSSLRCPARLLRTRGEKARLQEMFDELKAELVPLIREISALSDGNRSRTLYGSFDEKKQVGFVRKVVADFGYDWKRGRLDRVVHPFCIKAWPRFKHYD